MHKNALSLLVTAFAVLSSATGPPASWNFNQGPAPAPSSVRCFTKMGTTSVPWASSTSYVTSYFNCNPVTSTVTSTVTTAPPSVTTTSTTTTTTTTTAPTSSFTSTVTATATSSTNTVTTVSTTTTTTQTSSVVSTSTIPASSGFIPVQTSLPGSSCDTNCGADPVTKRRRGMAAYGGSGSPPNSGTSASGGNPWSNSNQPPSGSSKWKYQQGVVCQQYQAAAASTCTTSTKTVTTTVQGTSTGTITSTATSTVTSTVNPSATVTTTTTSTITTTNTITSTSTSTSTTVSTTTYSSTTVYAACATNNLADTYNGLTIENMYTTSGNPGADQTGTSTAYDCCVAALNDPNVGEAFEYADSVCTIFTNSGAQCSSQTNQEFGVFISSDAGAAQYVIGNAYCGYIDQTDNIS